MEEAVMWYSQIGNTMEKDIITKKQAVNAGYVLLAYISQFPNNEFKIGAVRALDYTAGRISDMERAITKDIQ